MTRTFKCGHEKAQANIIGSGNRIRCRACHETRKAMYAERNKRIGDMARAGATICEIADRFGLHRTTVGHIVGREGIAAKNPFTDDPAYPRRALEVAAACADSDLARLRSPSRFKCLVRARNAYALAMRERGMSYGAIGRKLNRDHSTVIHGVEIARILMDRGDTAFADIYHKVRKA